jgi:hypothetical protein
MWRLGGHTFDVSIFVLLRNGKSCDFDWVFEITEVRHPLLTLPDAVKYYWDPWWTASKYSTCRLHPKHWLVAAGLEEEDKTASRKTRTAPSAGLAYSLVTGNTPGAGGDGPEHDAHNDVLIEAKVVFDKATAAPGKGVWWYKHVASGIQLWENLFRSKKSKQAKIQEELSRPVPGQADDDGWKEGAAAATAAAEESQKQYGGGKTGPHVGGPVGRPISLVALILLFLPKTLLQTFADFSNKYWKQDVHKVTVTYGSKTSRRTFPCGASLGRECKWCDDDSEPEAEQRFKEPGLFGTKGRKPTILTWQSILCYIGILIAMGATRTRSWKHCWETKHFAGATTIPWVVAGMTSPAFEFHSQYLHFTDPTVHVGRDDPTWSPIYKVAPVINAVKSASKSLCNLGEFRTVDESGIGYKGRVGGASIANFVRFPSIFTRVLPHGEN